MKLYLLVTPAQAGVQGQTLEAGRSGFPLSRE
jgi:hypothetical protein